MARRVNLQDKRGQALADVCVILRQKCLETAALGDDGSCGIKMGRPSPKGGLLDLFAPSAQHAAVAASEWAPRTSTLTRVMMAASTTSLYRSS